MRGSRKAPNETFRCTRLVTAGFARFRERVNSNVGPIGILDEHDDHESRNPVCPQGPQAEDGAFPAIRTATKSRSGRPLNFARDGQLP